MPHATELLVINTRVNKKADAFVMAFTDGGPDHNISFLNVMISWLAYFIVRGCDILVVGRTAPTQSWTNPAKRLMSVLNLALSSCALAREPMDDEFEKNMKKCGGLTSVRKLAAKLESEAMRKSRDVVLPAFVATGDVTTSVVAASSAPAVVDASLVASGSSYGNSTIDDSNGKKDVFIATYIANIGFRLFLILFLLFFL